LIKNRKLKPGTQLVARHKGKEHQCDVVAGEDGRVRYRLKDGREFSSPSSAGSAVMGGVACNGWRFWTIAAVKDARLTRTLKKTSTRGVRPLTKSRPQRKVRVQRNGHTPEVR
jgi:hypothetical protein